MEIKCLTYIEKVEFRAYVMEKVTVTDIVQHKGVLDSDNSYSAGSLSISEPSRSSSSLSCNQNKGTYDSFKNGVNGKQNFSHASLNSFNPSQNFSHATFQSVEHSESLRSSTRIGTSYSDYSMQNHFSLARSANSDSTDFSTGPSIVVAPIIHHHYYYR